MSTAITRAWLEGLGFHPEAEPGWLQGQRPDFFCNGDRPFWIEVKSLDPPPETELLGRAFENFRKRCEALPNLTGDVYAAVGTALDGRAEKWVLGYVTRHVAVEGIESVVAVPQDADYASGWIEFEYESHEGRARERSVVARADRYPCYPSLEPRNWSDEVVITGHDGRQEARQLYDLFDSGMEPAVIARVFPSASKLSVHAVQGMEVYENRTVKRIREQVSEANSQIKNGQTHVAGPGICVIFHPSLDFAGDAQVAAALFGDIAMPIERGGRALGRPSFTRGGVWTATKNRSVSAVRYVRTPDSITTILNPWARYPIDYDLFREPVFVFMDNRLVEKRLA